MPTTITTPYPTDCASAIRLVCYLRAWTKRQLATAMGLRDATMLSKIVRHKVTGTEEMKARVLAMMPDVNKPKATTWPEERPQRIPDYTMGVGGGW